MLYCNAILLPRYYVLQYYNILLGTGEFNRSSRKDEYKLYWQYVLYTMNITSVLWLYSEDGVSIRFRWALFANAFDNKQRGAKFG